jgi:hypothetical protein
MDDLFRCPDCHAQHDEPLDAPLGHISRCFTCAVLAEANEAVSLVEPIRRPPVPIEIHIAA